MRDGIQSAGSADPSSVRFLVSAHAATEELFVLKQMVEGLLGADGTSLVSITWSHREKPQPTDTKFKIHATDAPNVNGARDLGFVVGAGNDGAPDLSALRTAVEGGRVKALYVIDPGPEGSLGDVSWVVAARRSGKLPLLIVQGVVTTDLTEAADIVLPGAAWVEKDAIYTNEQGLVQGGSKAINPPGEAREDWQILAGVAASLGLSMPYQSADDVRKALSAALPGSKVRRGALNRLHASDFGEQLAAGVESLRAVEVGFPVSGPAAGEGTQRTDGRRGRQHLVHSPQARRLRGCRSWFSIDRSFVAGAKSRSEAGCDWSHFSGYGPLSMRGLAAAIALLVVAPALVFAQFRGPRAELTPLVESAARAGGTARAALEVRLPSAAPRSVQCSS